MTKAICILVIVAVLYGGWHGFLYWERVKNDEETKEKEFSKAMNPVYLPGMPHQLEASYNQAVQRGNAATKTWLKTYGGSLQDPKKAWIELDYCVAITRENPAEARQVFRAVKERLPADSPLQVRLKQLEKTYQE
jgi:hypothetical protein